MKYIGLVLLLAGLWGCQIPGYYISESNLPVADSRKAITAVIGNPRVVSINGRELISVYHDSKFKPIAEDAIVSSRYYTKVVILGARRPYEINIQVIKEVFEKETQQFVALELDEGLTEKRAKEIRKAHNYSLEKTQAFDGDAPF